MNGITLAQSVLKANELIGKMVEIKADQNREFIGLIKAIDPLTGSVALMDSSEHEKSSILRVITGHSIKSIQACEGTQKLYQETLVKQTNDEAHWISVQCQMNNNFKVVIMIENIHQPSR